MTLIPQVQGIGMDYGYVGCYFTEICQRDYMLNKLGSSGGH